MTRLQDGAFRVHRPTSSATQTVWRFLFPLSERSDRAQTNHAMTSHSASPCPAKLSASTRTSIGFRARAVGALGIATLGLLLAPATARAQTTPTVFVANYGAGTISTYTTTGTLLNANFITGLVGPTNIAISGSDLYVSSSGSSTIGKYTTSGATQNASLITTGLNDPRSIVVSGSDLFVVNVGTPGNLQKYSTSGGGVVATLVTGLSGGNGLALSGTNLFEAAAFSQTLGKYSTTGVLQTGFGTNGLINPWGAGPGALEISGNTLFVAVGTQHSVYSYDVTTGGTLPTTITGLSMPTGLSLFGSSLFVMNYGNGSTTGSIGIYDLNTSSYSTLVSGLSGGAYGIAVANVSAIPEPSTYAALAGVAALGLAFWRKRRNPVAGAAK